ncbi:hypothetical protein JEZ13_07765 [bacterium]|nr:hypothetical protein [bacterium]
MKQQLINISKQFDNLAKNKNKLYNKYFFESIGVKIHEMNQLVIKPQYIPDCMEFINYLYDIIEHLRVSRLERNPPKPELENLIKRKDYLLELNFEKFHNYTIVFYIEDNFMIVTAPRTNFEYKISLEDIEIISKEVRSKIGIGSFQFEAKYDNILEKLIFEIIENYFAYYESIKYDYIRELFKINK